MKSKLIPGQLYQAKLKSIFKAKAQHHDIEALIWKFVIIKGDAKNRVLTGISSFQVTHATKNLLWADNLGFKMYFGQAFSPKDLIGKKCLILPVDKKRGATVEYVFPWKDI